MLLHHSPDGGMLRRGIEVMKGLKCLSTAMLISY